jgi:hypothetical protein
VRAEPGKNTPVKALAVALLAAATCFLSASRSDAASCGRADRPWVSVTFVGGDWPESLTTSVLGDLRVGLARHGIDACQEGAGPAHPMLAVVRIAWQSDPKVVVTVEINDSVTHKRVSRDVDLSSVPSDGRGFAIAIATDELVWASWVELAMKPREKAPPKPSPPREVVAGVETELPRGGGSRLGAQAALEHFGGGQTHIGGDATLGVPIGERFGFEARLGMRVGRDTAAEHGQVLSQALGIAAHVRYAMLRASSLELGALAGARASVLQFEGEAAESATDRAASGVVVSARAGVVSSLALGGGIWLELGGTAGYVLRGLEATDDGQVVSGASGAELGAALGLSVEL